MMTSRRQVLLAISQLVAAGSLAACGAADQQAATPTDSNRETMEQAGPESDLQLLAGVAYDLFPFNALDPSLYVQVAQRMLDMNSPAVAQGVAMLRENTRNQPWLGVDEAQRTDLLALLERSAFFTTMRATAIEVLFRDPAVFELLGYGGSAIEKGGYINRGFADITWLPEGR